jgi:hypothetical protein
MGPPSKRKTKRRSRNWSSQLGFLFFSMLFLLLSVQRNNVNADTDDAEQFDPSSSIAPNTTSTPNGTVTGKGAEPHTRRKILFATLVFALSIFALALLPLS